MRYTLSWVGSRLVLGGLSMPVLAILCTIAPGGGGGGRDGSSHFIHKAKEAIPQSIKRVSSKYQGGWFWSVPGMQGDGFASKPGGITKVEMWLCTPLLVGF